MLGLFLHILLVPSIYPILAKWPSSYLIHKSRELDTFLRPDFDSDTGAMFSSKISSLKSIAVSVVSVAIASVKLMKFGLG